MPIEGLRLYNIVASGKTGMKAYNTVALALHDVQVDADAGPAFLVRDSRGLELDRVTTRKALAGVPWSGWIVARARWCGPERSRSPQARAKLKTMAIEGIPAASESNVNYWAATAPAKKGRREIGAASQVSPLRADMLQRVISIKKYLDANRDELLNSTLECYRAALATMASTGVQACPPVGPSLQPSMANLRQRISADLTPAQVLETEADVEEERRLGPAGDGLLPAAHQRV